MKKMLVVALSTLALCACSGKQGGLTSDLSSEGQLSEKTDSLESSQSFVERAITYEFYELSSPIKEGQATTYAAKLEGVSNPNPLAVCGEAAALNASLKDASKEGYRFEGWFALKEQSKDLGDGTFSWSVSELTNLRDGYLGIKVCGFFLKYHALSVSSEDESMGSVSFLGETVSSACFGDEISVQATPKEGHAFKVWYRLEELVSEDNPYRFPMPSSDLTLKARFVKEGEEDKKRLGIVPVVDSSNKTLTYGLYPQKHVSDPDTVSSLEKLSSEFSDGWYLLDGDYYMRKKATPCGQNYKFDDGTPIASETNYWFKCEPITWRILSSSDGVHSLVSTLILDAKRYNANWPKEDDDGYYANNYARSEIRNWLNEDFYSSAFALGGSYLLATDVDNSASTTDSSTNPYVCESTNDKIYLLSSEDYANADFFASSAARQCRTSDWARASGAYCNEGTTYLNNGEYWTRSPWSIYYSSSWGVGFQGDLSCSNVDASDKGVRPGIRISFAE